MLIVTGPDESGLEDLALFCRRLGLETGGDAKGMQTAGEDAAVRIRQVLSQNLPECAEGEGKARSFLGKLGPLLRPVVGKNRGVGDRDRLQTEYAAAIQSLSCAAIVDPRFMRCPALLEAWHAIRNDVRVLLTYRAPEPSLTGDLREKFSDCIEMLLKLDVDFRILLHPQFLTQAEKVCAAFSELGLVFDLAEGERIWKDVAGSDTAAIGSTFLDQNETRR